MLNYLGIGLAFFAVLLTYFFFRGLKRHYYERAQVKERLSLILELYKNSKSDFKDDTKFLRSSRFEILKERFLSFAQDINSLKNPFLKKDIRQALSEVNSFIETLDSERLKLNEKFLEIEKRRAKDIFYDSGDNALLTDEQMRAVLCEDDRNLVIAGAGSGKTRVIDFKVRYLVNYKGVNPKKIILLSFSRKSAGDLIEKISENVSGVQARTIHSFSSKITNIQDKSLFDVKKREQESYIIKALVETLKESRVYDAFDEFYNKYFTQIKPLIFYDSLDELRRDLKKNNSKLIPVDDRFEEIKAKRTFKTLKGDYVRSVDERYIADFLFLQDIDYEYEKRYPHSDEYYYPDFYLPEYETYLEHFAIASNGQPPPYFKNPQRYLDGIEWKRKLHTEKHTKMLESFSYLLNQGKSSDYLSRVLVEGGIELKLKKDDEKAFQKISREFSKLFTKFYNTFKLSGLKITDLETKYTDLRYGLFLQIFTRFLFHFEKLVKDNNKMDFTDMLIGAIKEYEQGYDEKFDYIIVDEFQDTSNLAMKLLDSVYKAGGTTSFLSVGDDWQSIYGFNGSDVTILSDYENRYSGVSVQKLNNNFRSHSRVVELGKIFISKNPAQIMKDVTSLNRTYQDSEISFINFEQMEDKIKDIPDEESIFVLYRYNDDCPATVGLFKDYFSLNRQKRPYKKSSCDKNISLMTIHSSKGLEARHVFILFPDGINRKFPSDIEDHFIFNMLKNRNDDFPFSEERRLMYVAITRAEQNLYFVSPSKKDPNSVFWDELKVLTRGV